ncbi:hypothetical protein [Ruminococcus sp. CAG:330]|uniref:hypothetical protein n=1 Tax=Ruminococcus sp. CAG:330 TaxID=1262954 RepID=UPI000A5BAFB4|nr:hypothetical protein [Ruminococcus sp. CAG:330]
MKKPLRYDDAVGAFALCREGCCNKKHRAKTERFQNRYLIRLLQLSAAGEVFLEGTCPLSRRPQTAKSLRHVLAHGEGGLEKRQLFEGGANKTAPPCVPLAVLVF